MENGTCVDDALMAVNMGNVGIAIISRPPNHHKWVVKSVKNGWFIIAIPTLVFDRNLKSAVGSFLLKAS